MRCATEPDRDGPAEPQIGAGPARTSWLWLTLALLLAVGSLAGCSEGAPPSHGRSAAPEFCLPTVDGGEVQLADYRGKVVLLHFWATWCDPCLAAIPFEMELQKRYGPDGFVVIGMNVDRKPEKAREYLAANPVNYPVALADETTRRAFGGVSVIPYSVLVDRDGFIRKRELGLSDGDRVALERKIGFLVGAGDAS